MILHENFYRQSDVVAVANGLLGKLLVTQFDGIITSGKIVETEAYEGVIDKASHAFGNRRTKRTEIMYANGGIAYVYLCYGIHHLFNVVTNNQDVPHAVLIRAIEPVDGIETMMFRRKKKNFDTTLTAGPGSLSEALGIKSVHSGVSLQSPPIFIKDVGVKISHHEIESATRVGVGYAAEDALLQYRFSLKGNKYVSKGKGV
jgi:DNA-3-methyladenine glycosylase